MCEKICETSTPKKDNREYKFEYIQKDDLKQIVLFKNGENYYQQMRKKFTRKWQQKENKCPTYGSIRAKANMFIIKFVNEISEYYFFNEYSVAIAKMYTSQT